METKRAQVWIVFKSEPSQAFSVNDLVGRTGLSETQVRRAVQFWMEKQFITSAVDNYSGIGRKGKIVYYALSHEIYSKLG